MEYNKNQFKKTNDKKILHKIGKSWKAVSITLLMAIGGTAAAQQATHADTNTNTDGQTQANIKANQMSANYATLVKPQFAASTSARPASTSSQAISSASFSNLNHSTISTKTDSLANHAVVDAINNTSNDASGVNSLATSLSLDVNDLEYTYSGTGLNSALPEDGQTLNSLSDAYTAYVFSANQATNSGITRLNDKCSADIRKAFDDFNSVSPKWKRSKVASYCSITSSAASDTERDHNSFRGSYLNMRSDGGLSMLNQSMMYTLLLDSDAQSDLSQSPITFSDLTRASIDADDASETAPLADSIIASDSASYSASIANTFYWASSAYKSVFHQTQSYANEYYPTSASLGSVANRLPGGMPWFFQKQSELKSVSADTESLIGKYNTTDPNMTVSNASKANSQIGNAYNSLSADMRNAAYSNDYNQMYRVYAYINNAYEIASNYADRYDISAVDNLNGNKAQFSEYMSGLSSYGSPYMLDSYADSVDNEYYNDTGNRLNQATSMADDRKSDNYNTLYNDYVNMKNDIAFNNSYEADPNVNHSPNYSPSGDVAHNSAAVSMATKNFLNELQSNKVDNDHFAANFAVSYANGLLHEANSLTSDNASLAYNADYSASVGNSYSASTSASYSASYSNSVSASYSASYSKSVNASYAKSVNASYAASVNANYAKSEADNYTN